MNQLDIVRLRQEAERDLEALKRVEKMLRRDNGSSRRSIGTADTDQQSVPSKPNRGPNTGLKARIGEIVKLHTESGGLRPKNILNLVQSDGYSFSSSAVGASSVSSALRRFGAHVQKRQDGRYVWIEK